MVIAKPLSDQYQFLMTEISPPSKPRSYEHAHSPRGRSSAHVADYLRDMIVLGDLKAGARIDELAMTENLQVSRTPLREAFKILQVEGLVEIRPNRGAWVVSLSVQDVADIIKVLTALEGLAIEDACKNATETDLAELDSQHADMVMAYQGGDLMGYFALNQSIHLKIVECAGNPALTRIYQTESARVRRFRFAGNEVPTRWADAVEEHALILSVLRRREAGLLRELLKSHHQRGWQVAKAVLENERAQES